MKLKKQYKGSYFYKKDDLSATIFFNNLDKSWYLSIENNIKTVTCQFTNKLVDIGDNIFNYCGYTKRDCVEVLKEFLIHGYATGL